MSTILITGGNGYIGSHVYLELIKNPNINIKIIDNLSNSSKENLYFLEKISGSKVNFDNVDITDINQIDNYFKINSIDSIIHLASLKSVPESIINPSFYYYNNLIGLTNLLIASEKYNINKFVFSSSASIYSTKNTFPVSESGLISALNPYAKTKLFSEDILKRFYDSSINFSCVVLRYFNPIGCHPSGLIGDNNKGSNLMPKILNAINKNDCFMIFGDDYKTEDGTCIRDYIHVVDLSKAHIAALNYCYENKIFETFNVGTGKGVSVLELLNIFQEYNNVSIKTKITKRRKGDAPVSIANPTKINTILNWYPELSIKDMCTDSFNYYFNENEDI
jgi:UDP-glucose 4-epimerase